MRHFAHHIGDYAAATAHLSFIEDAAYHRLLRRYYQDEKPLPPNIEEICRLVGARTKEEKLAVKNVLGEFFRVEPDGFHQRRADEEIETYRIKAEIARLNGTKSRGRPGGKSKPKNNPAGFGWEPIGETNHYPLKGEPLQGSPPDEGLSRPIAARESAEGARTHDTASILANLGNMKRVTQ